MGAKTKHKIHLHFKCLYVCAITLLHACSVMSGLRVSDLQRISVLGFQGSTRNLDFKETAICFLCFLLAAACWALMSSLRHSSSRQSQEGGSVPRTLLGGRTLSCWERERLEAGKTTKLRLSFPDPQLLFFFFRFSPYFCTVVTRPREGTSGGCQGEAKGLDTAELSPCDTKLSSGNGNRGMRGPGGAS